MEKDTDAPPVEEEEETGKQAREKEEPPLFLPSCWKVSRAGILLQGERKTKQHSGKSFSGFARSQREVDNVFFACFLFRNVCELESGWKARKRDNLLSLHQKTLDGCVLI